MQPLYKIGQKVRCVSDSGRYINPGTILTICEVDTNCDDKSALAYLFKETGIVLYEHEIEPLTRSIREVKIGDVIIDGTAEWEVLDVGQKGFADDSYNYWCFEDAEEENLKIKQPEPECKHDYTNEGWCKAEMRCCECGELKPESEIEIAEEVDELVSEYISSNIVENRKLIIELQNKFNELAKLLRSKN